MNDTPTFYRRTPQGPTPAQVRLEGTAKAAIDMGRARLVAVTAVFALCFAVLAVRLVDLTLVRPVDDARLRAHATAPAIVARADITDRNGVLLATTLRTASLYADPRAITDPGQVAELVVAVLPGLDVRAVTAMLSRDRTFVWVQRHLTPRQQDAVNRLGIPGLNFLDEMQRVYPQGNLAAHVLGYVAAVSEAELGRDDRLKTLTVSDASLEAWEYVVCLKERRNLRTVLAFFELAGGETGDGSVAAPAVGRAATS